MLVLCLAIPFAAWAQSTTEGAVSGTVYDAAGAAIPNATVTITNNGTNATQTTTTDASGYFRVIRLQPARYSVTITVQGFAAYKATDVVVNVGTTTELAPHLKPAGSTETVEVTSEVPQINTTSSEFAPVVNEIAIKNLPINGGRWSNFVLLTPGVVNDSNGFGLVSFKGMSTLLNNNTVDGADNNQAFFSEERGRTRIGYSTPKAAVQEFQVNTSNYSSEYGRSVGGVINTVTKSGTNNLHGELYFYDRDAGWGAMNPFTTITTLDPSTGKYTPKQFKPKDWRKMTGASIGGPIIKDKLFFQVTFDFYDRNFPGTSVASSPSSFFATPTSAQITTFANRLGLGTDAATTLYNNDMTALLTTSGPTPRNGVSYIWLPKIDWQISQKNHLSFVLNRARWDSPAGIQTQATNPYGIRSFGNDYVKVTWGVVKLSTSITNNLVNEFRVQYGRDFEYENPQVPTAYEQANLVSSSLFPAYTNPFGLPPELLISNGWNLGVANFLTRPKYPDERRQQYTDTMSWAHGKHLIKYGVDFTHAFDRSENLRYQFGSFSYTGSNATINYFSDLYAPDTCTQTFSGNTVHVPCYSSMTQAFGPLGFSLATNDYGFYLQDDWKVLPRLNLTLGLRYDYEQLPSVFTSIVNPAVPQTSKMPSDKNNWGPRFGFAYDLTGDGKTSIRGGFGVVYGRIINSTIFSALTQTGMVGSQLNYSASTTSPSTYGCALAFPQVYPDVTGFSACRGGLSVAYFDPHFQNPQANQVDLSLEREIAKNTVLQLSYIGSFGRHLADFVDTNIQPATSKVPVTIVGGGPAATNISEPVYTKRINTSYGAITDIISGTTSSYNALAVQVNRRLSNHLQYNASFTWSHALDYGQNNTTFISTNSLLDPYNLAAEKGNSNQNVPHRFVFSAVAQSPWKLGGVLGNLTNDWQLAPLYQWQNGLPYSARTSGSVTGALSGGINGSNGDYRVPGLRNAFRQPDTHVVDMKLSKLLRFHERYSAELSGEFFNLMNHPNVTSVDSTAYNVSGTAAAPTLTYRPTFGRITNADSNFAYSPRQIQVGINIKF